MPSPVSATHCVSRTTDHRRASLHLAPAIWMWLGPFCCRAAFTNACHRPRRHMNFSKLAPTPSKPGAISFDRPAHFCGFPATIMRDRIIVH
jgi:hypothetical protein